MTKRFGDDWLTSRSAVNWFLIATFFALTITPVAFGVIDMTRLQYWLRFLLGLLAIAGAPAALFLFYGMWAYWLRIDASSHATRRFWFFVLLFVWVGAALYYFFSYRPQVLRRLEKQL